MRGRGLAVATRVPVSQATPEGDPVAPETSVSVEVHATFLGMLAVQRSLDGPRG